MIFSTVNVLFTFGSLSSFDNTPQKRWPLVGWLIPMPIRNLGSGSGYSVAGLWALIL